jgi:ATP synthase protein I
MPFHRPIPDSERKPQKSPGLHSLVQAEKVMQIAFILPCAMVLGWGAGWCVDHFLHTHWATFAGLIFGIVAGMVTAIRMAMDAMNSLPGQDPK